MARTFAQMAAEALAQVPAVTPAEARNRLQQNASVLIIDVRDAADIGETGTIPGAMNISLGSLTYKADTEVPEDWREPALQDRSRPCTSDFPVRYLSRPQLAGFPGLRWKVWIFNEAESEAGGIYLFADDASMRSFIGVLTTMLEAPEFSEISIKTFDILEPLTLITRGPIQETVRTGIE